MRVPCGAVTAVQSVPLVTFSPRVQELSEQAWTPEPPLGGRWREGRS